ncbi:MAG: SHOCT domain-containing protein [Lachnospiraceae bacterium]|nr:SHOCT domain-containing protein [Lachnospiraceae bacterium]
MTYDEKIEAVKKLKELLDVGILTQEEFDKKKKELLSL